MGLILSFGVYKAGQEVSVCGVQKTRYSGTDLILQKGLFLIFGPGEEREREKKKAIKAANTGW